MTDENITEADYIEDGSDYLEEHQCKPCDDCIIKTVAIIIIKISGGMRQLRMKSG